MNVACQLERRVHRRDPSDDLSVAASEVRRRVRQARNLTLLRSCAAGKDPFPREEEQPEPDFAVFLERRRGN